MGFDKRIRFKNLSRVLMMIPSAVDKSEVMKSRYGINHIGVH